MVSIEIDDWTIRIGGQRFGMVDRNVYGIDLIDSSTTIEIGAWGRLDSPISAKVGLPLLGVFALAALLILAKAPSLIQSLKKSLQQH
jgi:hypothetical protein